MSKLKIYHNPRCSKSRQALSLLEDNGHQPEIIEYLKQPPSADELKALLQLLGIPARQLLRTGEEAYKTLGLADPSLSEQALIEAMCQQPKLIERPIIITNQQAIIGRPPEKALDIL